MKNKIYALLLCAAVILSAGACAPNESKAPANKSGSTKASSEVFSESRPAKVLLKLRKYDLSEKSGNETEAADFIESECLIDGVALPETEQQPFLQNDAAVPITDHIRKEFGLTIDDNWLFTVHYYNEEQSDGLIQFVYTIGKEIKTNRAVTFFIESGKIHRMTHSYLDSRADEAALIAAKAEFENTYEQERINPLGEGWSVDGETTDYVYNYKTNQLKYSYNIFLIENEIGIINNDYGTEVIVPYARTE